MARLIDHELEVLRGGSIKDLNGKNVVVTGYFEKLSVEDFETVPLDQLLRRPLPTI